MWGNDCDEGVDDEILGVGGTTDDLGGTNAVSGVTSKLAVVKSCRKNPTKH